MYTLRKSFVDGYKNVPVKWGFGGLGYLTYKRTYAQDLPDGSSEEWYQTCERVINGWLYWLQAHLESQGRLFARDTFAPIAEKMYQAMFKFKWLPAGRGLQHMGRDAVRIKGAEVLNSCAFTSTEGVSPETYASPFVWAMDKLMLGVGVGFDTLGRHKGIQVLLPQVDEEYVFIVEDTREGWLALASAIILPFTNPAHRLPSMVDYSGLRKAGTPLKIMGGTASGHEPLEQCVSSLIQLYSSYIGKTVDSRLITDTFNIVARCVVSGGIRRSAEIGLGEEDDLEFIHLKDFQRHANDPTQPIKNWRWASNNSIKAHVGMDYEYVAKCLYDFGSPGLLWLDNARNFGRMNAQDEPILEPLVMGANPCNEQSLEHLELCNLAETFPANCDDLGEWHECTQYAYMYAKVVSTIPLADKAAQEIVNRNRRLGISISGVQQAIAKYGKTRLYSAMDKAYKALRSKDRAFSRYVLNVNESVKLTSVKPSGTISLLAGATPGVHAAISEYYIRRVRVSDNSPLTTLIKQTGLKYEPDDYAPNTTCVEVPVKVENFTVAEKDVPMREQFQNAADLQKYWADNQVSVTVKFFRDRDTASDIVSLLKEYETQLKGMSLMAGIDFTQSGDYTQPPYEPITKETYEERIKGIDFSVLHSAHRDSKDAYCDSDTCFIVN